VTSRGPLMEAAVRVDRLEKTLGPNKVLRGISLEARSGEIFGLLGPNGAGKTTTLRVICTLLGPDAGSVDVLGFDTRTQPEEVRRRVGVVTAEIGVYPRLSARENIAYFAELSGILDGEVSRRVDVTDRGGRGVPPLRASGDEAEGVRGLGLVRPGTHGLPPPARKRREGGFCQSALVPAVSDNRIARPRRNSAGGQ